MGFVWYGDEVFSGAIRRNRGRIEGGGRRRNVVEDL